MVNNTKKTKSAKTVKTRAKSTVKAAKTSRKKPTGVKGLWSRLNKKVAGVAAVVVVVAAAFIGIKVLPALATGSILWSSGVPTVLSAQDLGTDSSSWRDACQAKFHAPKASVQVVSSDPTMTTDCILGSHNGVNVYTFNNQSQVAIQPAGETVAYPTQAVCQPNCIYLPNKDQLIRVESTNTVSTGRVAIYDNFTSRLHAVDGTYRYYSFDNSSPTLISNYFGQPGYVGYVGFIQKTNDERWLVMDVAGAGLFRVDLNSSPLQLFKFSNWVANYNFPLPAIQFAISDGGDHVALTGDRVDSYVFDITSTCGGVVSSQSESAMDVPLTNSCPFLDLKAPQNIAANNTWMPNLSNSYQPIFDSTSGQLTFYGVSSDASSNKLIVLRAANFNPSPSPSPSPTTGPTPTDKSQCMKEGWKSFNGKFKNQGDCVSFVESPAKQTQ